MVDRRDPRLERRRERADDPLLRPLRRPAAGAARALGVGAVRGDDPRRVALRARRRRRQGPALDAAARRRASSPPRARSRSTSAIASDGEEEVGGQSIVEFLQQDERGADACVIFDGGMERRDLPAISVATRGLAAFNLRVKTGERDLHSGMYGNAALNAIHALNQTLTGILPRDGRVPEALRVGIVPATDEERAGWAKQPGGRRRPPRGGRGPVRPARGRRVLPPHDGRDLRRRQRDPRRQARPEEHDRDQRGAGELHRPARARARRRRPSSPRSSGCCTRPRPTVRRSRSRSCPARPARASSPPTPR